MRWRMSAFGGKADVVDEVPVVPVLALTSREWWPAQSVLACRGGRGGPY